MFNGNKRVNMQHAAACNMRLVTSDIRRDRERVRDIESDGRELK